jgi:hypothetical protein
MRITYENVLVEIDDKHFDFNNPVKVLHNHNPEKIIGLATFKNTDFGLYADIVLNRKLPNRDHWPSIGFKRINDKKGIVICLGIGAYENVDSKIPKL